MQCDCEIFFISKLIIYCICAIPLTVMGGKSSKITKYASESGRFVKEAGTSFAVSVVRKIKKPGRQFMAPERTEKILRNQNEIPRRAPLNIKKIDMPTSIRQQKMKEIEKEQRKDDSYLELMKDVYLTSNDPNQAEEPSKTDHSHSRSKDLKEKLPKSRTKNSGFATDLPKGRANLDSIILALYNHRMDPDSWTDVSIAEKINIRQSDAEGLLKYFKLLNNKTFFRIKSSSLFKT